MRAAIFDVDGTLCDVSGIRFWVNPDDPKFPGKKNWERFHASAIDCPPNEQALDLYRAAVDDGYKIIVVTARMRQWEIPTKVWLRRHGVAYEKLYMRGYDDYRKDYVVKAEILEMIRDDGYTPVMAVDDNPNVIRLWREQDIRTYIIDGWES